MSINLYGRSLLSLNDFTPREIEYLLELAKMLKAKKLRGEKGSLLDNKNIALIFDKPSTRTIAALSVATHDEAGHVTELTNSHLGHKESLEDTAKVLGRMFDGIAYRGYAQSTVEILSQSSGVPVWNALTNQEHPTQILADLLTIREHCSKPLNQIKLVFVGDTRSNMGLSLLIGCAKMGMHFVGLAPKQLWSATAWLEQAKIIAQQTGARVEYQEEIQTAVEHADVIYTDVWCSMGEEQKLVERLKLLAPYQVTMKMLQQTDNPNILFMHCLPAIHDVSTDFGKLVKQQSGLTAMEVTDEVFRSLYSIVFDQAENRLHTIKAVIVATIGNI
jgi:ornithine carbamoyltransferase